MSTPEPSGAQRMFGDFAPALVGYTDEVLFGDVWKRDALAPRDRSLVTVACLVTCGNTDQLVLSPRPRQGQRRHRAGTDRGDHPPRVLRRLAQGDGRHGSGQEGLPRRYLTRARTRSQASHHNESEVTSG